MLSDRERKGKGYIAAVVDAPHAKHAKRNLPEPAGEQLRIVLSILVKRRGCDRVHPEAKIVAKYGVVALPCLRRREGRGGGGENQVALFGDSVNQRLCVRAPDGMGREDVDQTFDIDCPRLVALSQLLPAKAQLKLKRVQKNRHVSCSCSTFTEKTALLQYCQTTAGGWHWHGMHGMARSGLL